MNIASFSVKNFRSITTANELPLYKYSILVGPNNQGKSNILEALVLVLKVLQPYNRSYSIQRKRDISARFLSRYRERERSQNYDYQRDYPLNLQISSEKTGTSEFTIVFKLDSKEKTSFERYTSKKLKGELRIKVAMGDGTRNLVITDTEDEQISFDKFHAEIRRFLYENYEIASIGAMRDISKTLKMVGRMADNTVFTNLSKRERERYAKLEREITKIQKPFLDKLSKELTSNVSKFLPGIKRVYIDAEESRQPLMTSTTLHVDDGTDTPLEYKGDGIKSLMAISILQYETTQRARRKSVILAIDEPESHLHPDAIRKLKPVLEEISKKNQVIIATHSPLLIDRMNAARHVIVDESQAEAARNITAIRKTLGVKIADNLQTAEVIILTEGKSDAEKLEIWLSERSNTIKNAIDKGIIAFNELKGASHLSQGILYWQTALCDVFAFIDNDQEGQSARCEALKNESIKPKNITLVPQMGQTESEIEDLILPKWYADAVKKRYGVDLNHHTFKKGKHKWSDRMKKVFDVYGQLWDDTTKSEIKKIITEVVKKEQISSIHLRKRKVINEFAKNLEEHMGRRQYDDS